MIPGIAVFGRRRHLVAFSAIALGLIGFSALLLLTSEVERQQTRFSESVQAVSAAVRNQLDTNEAVVAGFSAFLQAVDQSDTEAANRYAAAVLAAYPQIYMLEAARAVPTADEARFEAQLRRDWRPDFLLKNFPSLAQQPSQQQASLHETWPILFMYPALPQASAIYGVRLETVPWLSFALARTYDNSRPVASPVFTMYEGENAYILMQFVNRPRRAEHESRPNFFGNTMVAMLVSRTNALLDIVNKANIDPWLHIDASLQAAAGIDSHVLSTLTHHSGSLDRFLPRLTERVVLSSASQPMTLSYSRQLRMEDVLTVQTLVILALLLGALVMIPILLVKHFNAMRRAEDEHKRSAYLASHDVLTELPNRYQFADRFVQAVAAWETSGAEFAVMLIDLDHFKQINDEHGHEVGDQVLRAVAERMRSATRPQDTVGRHGGDEFVALITHLPDAASAEFSAARIFEAINQPVATEAGTLAISCSIGIALCPHHGEDLDDLLKAADRAMYGVKQLGRKGMQMTEVT